MSDTLLYFLNLFLNTSASILNFFNLQMVCSITILFLEWLLLYSLSSTDRSMFLFFLFGMDDNCSGKSFSTPRKVSKVNYINNLFGCDGTTLFIYSYIVMFSSFLIFCFMHNNTLLVTHQLQLYSMFFLCA